MRVFQEASRISVNEVLLVLPPLSLLACILVLLVAMEMLLRFAMWICVGQLPLKQNLQPLTALKRDSLMYK